MMKNDNIAALAEGFVQGTLSNEASVALAELRKDAAFEAEFMEYVHLLKSLKDNGQHKEFRATLDAIQQDIAGQNRPVKDGKTLKLTYWRTAGVAAAIALVTSLATFWVAQHNNKKMASQYSLLRRDLEKYKRSQSKILGDIKKQTSTPQLQARYTGTGFALANDGYIATSYHVVHGADSVYIQHADGNYYKTQIVTFNAAADVVVLKVEDEQFSFSSAEVPYSIKDKRPLAAKVYTLGFPQDEIVYNEGYISAKNGFGGDTTQFRLDIQAGPGQSGAPVVDAAGNVIGIITGKESEYAGATYAVSSAALLDLLNNLPEENKIKLNATNRLGRLNREKQIEKLEQYTCAIKVYKK